MLKITIVVVTNIQNSNGQQQKHKHKHPEDFDCAWRKAAFDFGKKIHNFRCGIDQKLFEALELEKCENEIQIDLNDRISDFRESIDVLDDKKNLVKIVENDENVIIDVVANSNENLPNQFNNIQKAIDHAAEIQQQTDKQVVVQIHEGVYELDETIFINEKHNDLKIVGKQTEKQSKFCSSNKNNKPKIIAGQVLKTNWEKLINSQTQLTLSPTNLNKNHNIYVTKIENFKKIKSLFVDGQRAIVARYPNYPNRIKGSHDSIKWSAPAKNKERSKELTDTMKHTMTNTQ